MLIDQRYTVFEEAKVACRDCEIGKVYNRVICSDGCKVNPLVVICGEAPGKDEVTEGKPFVGKAGKLLRSTLNEFGFKRSNSLITNVIPCRPENNKFPSDNKLVNSCVSKWLKNEIEILSPKYMLLVGAKPLKFLLGTTGITKLRGEWYSLFDSEILCMPTFHPSYVLRKQYMKEGDEIKNSFRQDIKEVAIKSGFIQ